MAGLFKATDILLAAQEVETRGEIFYNRLVEIAEDQQVKETFLFLAGEETKHRETFAKLYERLGQAELPAWAEDDEYASYLSFLIDSHTLFQLGDSEKLREFTGSREEALKIAMGFEKDTILFFSEMREFVPDGERKHIEDCIEEERSHLRLLAGLLKG